MGYQLERAFAAAHDFLASTIRAAGPWAVPMVLAVAGLTAMANRDKLLTSGFGVFLVLATAAVVTIVIAFQTGRV